MVVEAFFGIILAKELLFRRFRDVASVLSEDRFYNSSTLTVYFVFPMCDEAVL